VAVPSGIGVDVGAAPSELVRWSTERLASFLKGVTAPWPHIPPLDCRLGHRRRSSPSTGLQRRGPTDVAEVAGDGTHGGLFP
jgi:hypothetical protein